MPENLAKKSVLRLVRNAETQWHGKCLACNFERTLVDSFRLVMSNGSADVVKPSLPNLFCNRCNEFDYWPNSASETYYDCEGRYDRLISFSWLQ